MAPYRGTLTVKERAFVRAYLGVCKGNGTRAAIAAGYSAATAPQAGSRLLTNVKVRAEVDARLAARDKATIADATERDEILTKMLRGVELPGNVPYFLRKEAIRELNKCDGRHTQKHVHSGTLTWAQWVEDSRKP